MVQRNIMIFSVTMQNITLLCYVFRRFAKPTQKNGHGVVRPVDADCNIADSMLSLPRRTVMARPAKAP